MINFNFLQLVVNNKYSFVGIDKQEQNLRLCLPKGFNQQKSTLDNFDSKRDLFFLFYKIFTTFKSICLEKSYLDDNKQLTNDRDGVLKTKIGSGIKNDQEDNENIFYSKIDILGKLLDAYNEPKILSLASRLGKQDKFDLSKIHKYLHQGIYLSNNAVYIDQMNFPRKVVQFQSTDIVTMYCYLFCEIKQQLKETINPNIISLAEDFRERYLNSQDSLFDENSYESVLNALKDALETINNYTVVKDADYWEYYDAIELFLYGDLSQADEGEIWGINNFHTVWESMCLNYLAKNNNLSFLLHCDTRYLSPQIVNKLQGAKKVLNIDNVFEINGISLNPDAVLFNVEKDNSDVYKIYELQLSKWNENFYHIVFDYKWNNHTDTHHKKSDITRIPIAYKNQKPKKQGVSYTSEELKELYTSPKLEKLYTKEERTQEELDAHYNGHIYRGVARDEYLIIDSPLPDDQFYSFWDIPDNIDNEYLNVMEYFNHFFYLALKKKIDDWDIFCEHIFKPLNIDIDESGNFSEDNVFTKGIFRNKYPIQIKNGFEKFIKQFKNQVYEENKTAIKLIDMKYHEHEYFFNINARKENKEKNVRKQFVYEYLLQKRLKKHFSSDSEPEIEGSFWIPDYRPDDSNLFKRDHDFLDGYIELNKVNFLLLAETYITN